MANRSFLMSVVCVALASVALAQTSPQIGLRDNTPTVHAFINARIVQMPGKIIANGTLVVRNAVIESVGEHVVPPADAQVFDLKGETVYPGLIDLSSDIGVPKPAPPRSRGYFDFSAPTPPAEPSKGPADWNSKVKADFEAGSEFVPDPKLAEQLRSQGFTVVLATPQVGIFRGTSSLVNLGEGEAARLVMKRNVAQTVSFEVTGGFGSTYPNSLMGVIALIRQTWLDANWYRRAQESFASNPDQKRPEQNKSLAALADAAQGKQPVVLDVADDLNFLRGAKIAKEFSLRMWVRGSGFEYRRMDEIKATQLPVIVTLNFPETPSVESPEEAMNYSLEELQHWDAAPENPGRLEKAGIPIVLTSATLKNPATFLHQVRTAVERGLAMDDALAALTTTPAHWLGLEKQLGSLEEGKAADFFVADGDLFSEKTKINSVWIDGKEYDVKKLPVADPRGVWDFKVSSEPDSLDTFSLKGELEKLSGTLKWNGKNLKILSASFAAERIALDFSGDSIGQKGAIRLSGTVGSNDMVGVGEFPDGNSFTWTALRRSPPRAQSDTTTVAKKETALFQDTFPPGEFGRTKVPEQYPALVVRNATIWTVGKQGKLKNADMLILKGKISQIGKNLRVPEGAFVVDASGEDITPGIIDAHSHTAISGGVNEGSHAITAEVRIRDVLDPDDIWIYRELAGGTTISNVLHGSANPIGGQNAIVKWRWGMSADEMLLEGAPPGIKFALGENVKQSNFMFGGHPSTRYPQTREGVEQIIKDEFNAALDYERASQEWEKDKSKIPPRRNLQLEAVLEIIKGKRQIHCHAYRSDEMMMLMHLMDQFGVKIAAFHHVLEGYKIADEMAKRGIAGTTFSDWWAYKMEAWDAIPGNGPLMHDEGIVVSYNSDSDDLARRLNWEASKAVRFGIPEEEALKFVTINSAVTLGIDKWVGSLEVGKDADFVVWNGDPLSAYSKCLQTWIDGRKFFDVKEDQEMEAKIQKERAALIQKILASKNEQPSERRGPFHIMRPDEYGNNSCIDGQVEIGGNHEN